MTIERSSGEASRPRTGPIDLVLRGGRVVDPAQGIDAYLDVLIHDGAIVEMTPDACAVPSAQVLDVRGSLVVPGLIDLHTHTFYGISSYAVEPDRAGIRAGVTHINDMGSTGAFTFMGFRHWVVPSATTDITCFPNVIGFGLPENWGAVAVESGPPALLADQLIKVGEKFPTIIRGVKCHLEPGEFSWAGWGTIDAAVTAATSLGVPIYCHLGNLFPTNPNVEAPDPDKMLAMSLERLRPGDLIGHVLSGHGGALIREDGSLNPAAREIPASGCLTEVGYGVTTTFAASRIILDAGIVPDIISSDLHVTTPGRATGVFDHGSVLSYSLVGTMTKMLALGVPLSPVIAGATSNPARVLNLHDRKGTLRSGVAADITILDQRSGSWELHDNAGEVLTTDTVLVPTRTIKNGRIFELDAMALPEFRQEYVASGIRSSYLTMATPLSACARVKRRHGTDDVSKRSWGA